MKTIWMISGDRGGIGKSLFCLALASLFEWRSETFAIFDGDGRTGDVHECFDRKVPSRHGDFRNLRPESHLCSYDESYQKSLYQLLKHSDNLIVNTPDGADLLLMKWFDVTLQHTESHDVIFKFIYIMSERGQGIEILPQLEQRFSFLYPVKNLHFGPPNLFVAFDRDYHNDFNEVCHFPELRGEEVRTMFALKASPAEMLVLTDKATGTFTVPSLARSRIVEWLNDFDSKFGHVIDNKTDSNIRVPT